MAKDLTLNIVAAASVAGAVKGLSELSKSFKTLKDNTENLSKTSKKLENFDKVREKLTKVNAEYKTSSEALKKLKQEYNSTGQGNAEFAKTVKDAEKHVNKLANEKSKLTNAFSNAKQAIESEGHSLKDYRDTLHKVNKELEVNKQLKSIQNQHQNRLEAIDKVESFGDRATVRGLAAGAATVLPLKLKIELEEAQADLRKVAEFGSKQLEKEFYQAMRNLSDNSPLSQKELFEIAGAGAQAGINTRELAQYTKDASKIKVAFDMDTQAAGNFLAKTRAQFGIGQKEVMEYADVINYLANSVAVTAPELVDISQRVAGLGGIAGISKESVMAMGATLIASGVNSEVAATGLKNFSLGLVAGTSATNTQKKAFESLGLSAEQVAKDMQVNADKTIINVLSKVKQLPEHLRAATLKNLFGKESIQSVTELMNHLDDLGGAFENVHNKAKTAGSVDKEYADRLKTLKTALDTLKNNLVNIGIDLGSALAPSLLSLTNSLKPVVKSIADFVQKNPQLAAGIMKAVGAFALFNLGVGGAIKVGAPLARTLSSTVSIFQKLSAVKGLGFTAGIAKAFPTVAKLGSVFKGVGSIAVKSFGGLGKIALKSLNPFNAIKLAVNGLGKGFSGSLKIFSMFAHPLATFKKLISVIKMVGIALKGAFLANPVGVIVGALVGLVAIFVILYKKSTWFRNGVNNAMKQIAPHVKELGRVLKQTLGQAIQRVKSLMVSSAPAMRAVWNSLKPVISAIGTVIKVVLIIAIRVAIAAVKSLGNTFKLIIAVVRGVMQMVSGAFRVAVGIWKGIFQLFVAFFTGKWNEIPGIVSGVWNAVKGGISSFVGGAKTILSGLFNWFKDQWNNLKNLASNIGGVLGFGKHWTGTNYFEGGYTTVAERGAELIKVPGQLAFLAEHEMMLNLPKGTQILNNSQTRNTLSDRIGKVKERVSKSKNNGGNSFGGDTINIAITVGNGSNPNAIAQAVERVLRDRENRKRRVAFG